MLLIGISTDWEADTLFKFHATAGEGDKHIDVHLDRGLLKTVSTTQVKKTVDDCSMTYHDFQKNEEYNTVFDLVTFDI
ncbi:MAG: hypothetical protein ACI86L_000955 [Dokdonia sp.]